MFSSFNRVRLEQNGGLNTRVLEAFSVRTIRISSIELIERESGDDCIILYFDGFAQDGIEYNYMYLYGYTWEGLKASNPELFASSI